MFRVKSKAMDYHTFLFLQRLLIIRSHPVPTVLKYLMALQSICLIVYERYTNLHASLLQYTNYITFCVLNWEMIFHHLTMSATLKEGVTQRSGLQTIEMWKQWVKNLPLVILNLFVVYCPTKWRSCELWLVTT